MENERPFENGDRVKALHDAIWPKGGGCASDALRPKSLLKVEEISFNTRDGVWWAKFLEDERLFPANCFALASDKEINDQDFLDAGFERVSVGKNSIAFEKSPPPTVFRVSAILSRN